MPKSFYSVKEASDKLTCTADDLKVLVSRGELREFRDGGKLNFKVTEVDALVPGESTLGAELLNEIYNEADLSLPPLPVGNQFEYEAMNAAGHEVKDVIEASSPEDALAKIRNLGVFPTRIKEKIKINDYIDLTMDQNVDEGIASKMRSLTVRCQWWMGFGIISCVIATIETIMILRHYLS